ncbi:Uu.00g142440.m01.CDS01 [Anthostomella pinea]|uniref:Uu.00g142440.m01.CDS01 n=1 Tax=Anthostomella pinea TaxID=933095 RepID=A0AAI8VQH0_9PEZI|nr:Uu.00g142440.m01.CDS01 [Anthostomella pinea]
MTSAEGDEQDSDIYVHGTKGIQTFRLCSSPQHSRGSLVQSCAVLHQQSEELFVVLHDGFAQRVAENDVAVKVGVMASCALGGIDGHICQIRYRQRAESGRLLWPIDAQCTNSASQVYCRKPIHETRRAEALDVPHERIVAFAQALVLLTQVRDLILSDRDGTGIVGALPRESKSRVESYWFRAELGPSSATHDPQ